MTSRLTNIYTQYRWVTPLIDELKTILALGIPMGLTQLVQMITYTIDVVMIGRIGPTEVAATALGTVFFWTLWMVGFGPIMAVTPLVSQALGANNHAVDDVRLSVRMALLVTFCLFPVAIGIGFFAEEIALFLGQPEQIAGLAERYLVVLMPGWYFGLATMILRNFLATLGQTRVPLLIIIFSTLINAGINYLLIFGSFGFPRLELVGAGIASSITSILTFAIFIIYIRWDKDASRFSLFTDLLTFDRERFWEVIKLGLPISVTTLFEGMLFNTAVFLMGMIGSLQVAAYHIALNVAAMAFMLPFGLSMAGAVRIGLAAGAKDLLAVKRAAIATIIAAAAVMLIFAVLVALMPITIAQVYLDATIIENQDVISMVASFLSIAAGFMFFDGVQVAANQLLRGLKDVRVPMILSGASYWAIGFVTATYLGLYTPLAAKGVWWGLLVGLVAASITLGLRLIWVIHHHPFNQD
ncbi:MAG: MATE family efflux transporter [bacterium]